MHLTKLIIILVKKDNYKDFFPKSEEKYKIITKYNIVKKNRCYTRNHYLTFLKYPQCF